jgi:hypothetical protein
VLGVLRELAPPQDPCTRCQDPRVRSHDPRIRLGGAIWRRTGGTGRRWACFLLRSRPGWATRRAGGDGQRGEEGVRRGWIVWEKAFIAWSISILAHAGLGMAMFSLGLYISVTALLNASVAVSCIAASTSLILHC